MKGDAASRDPTSASDPGWPGPASPRIVEELAGSPSIDRIQNSLSSASEALEEKSSASPSFGSTPDSART